jgi:hypothetical protein
MQALYFILAAVHIVSLAVTGILWTIIVLVPSSSLKHNFRDIRAVHFGSLYLISLFLGLAYAFERLGVPAWDNKWVRLVRLGLLTVPARATIGEDQPGRPLRTLTWCQPGTTMGAATVIDTRSARGTAISTGISRTGRRDRHELPQSQRPRGSPWRQR